MCLKRLLNVFSLEKYKWKHVCFTLLKMFFDFLHFNSFDTRSILWSSMVVVLKLHVKKKIPSLIDMYVYERY